MPKRFRLTRRFPVAMTEDGYRKLRGFAREAGLDEGEVYAATVIHPLALVERALARLYPE